jgi:mannose-6-phosphate isomerase-like protein (cupin superfamily)
LAQGIEVYEYSGPGYKPLVYSQDWMVARLNFEAIMELDKAVEIEMHKETDEVFILLKGKAAFYLVAGEQPLQVVELKPGLVYNVPKGTWHNLLATREAEFVIVENRDTDKYDTEIRSLADKERKRMLEQLPGWVKPTATR